MQNRVRRFFYGRHTIACTGTIIPKTTLNSVNFRMGAKPPAALFAAQIRAYPQCGAPPRNAPT